MRSRMAMSVCAFLVLGALAGCTAAPAPEPFPATPPATEQPPAAGLRLAPGLYELEDGTAQVMGTLGYRDLEGGFWQITGGTEADGGSDKVIAVIANGADFESQLKALDGKQVFATGTKLEGASIRMAGPEIEMTKIEEVSDTPGIAE